MANIIYDIKNKRSLNDKITEPLVLFWNIYDEGLITDTYGYAPILKLQRRIWVIKPKYDTQEAIYHQQLLLEPLINVKSKVEGDLLYGENMIKMEKFCNSSCSSLGAYF
jgi:hypothetical protein